MTISQPKPDELLPRPAIGGERGVKPPSSTIIRVGSDRRNQAIERLVGSGSQMDYQHAQRFLDYSREHRIGLDLLWAGLDRDGQIRFSVLAVPNPGRTAMMFATHPTSRDQTAPIGELIDHACIDLRRFDVDLAQALLDPTEILEQESFTAGGFFRLATLSYLERSLRKGRGDLAAVTDWPKDVEPIGYTESLKPQLLELLDASYEDTLDCPGLRGFRRTVDILEGHRASGVFDPTLWTLLRVDGRIGAALLLNPAADLQSIELVYLGLAKWARRRGLGRMLLRHGLAMLTRRNERVVNLAVDETNVPALALYRSEGFVPVLRRIAMIRPVHEIAARS